MPGNLVVRADAGPKIGSGHVMRCLALAQRWQTAGGAVTFAATECPTAVERRIKAHNMGLKRISCVPGSCEDALKTTTIADQLGASWVVLDGYRFGEAYQERIRSAGMRRIVLDDCGHATHYHADLLLNQNLGAHAALYSDRAPGAKLLLGPRYALLRQDFLTRQGWRRRVPEKGSKVLVTLGGSAPEEAVEKIIEGLGWVRLEGLETQIVLGHVSGRERRRLSSLADRLGPAARVHGAVSDMAEKMAWADVSISAAGSTAWELAFMGLPNIALVLAENQRAVADRLDAAGTMVNLGPHQTVSSAQIAEAVSTLLNSAAARAEMARRGQALVDGEGSARVVTHLVGRCLRLRPAKPSDCELLWDWANDADTRSASFSTRPIPWEEHARWFKDKLEGSDSVLTVATDTKGKAIGTARFDVSGDEAVVSVNVNPSCRSKGYGSAVISRACEQVMEIRGLRAIHAYIKPTNKASTSSFLRAGFRECGECTFRGHEALHLLVNKEAMS